MINKIIIFLAICSLLAMSVLAAGVNPDLAKKTFYVQ